MDDRFMSKTLRIDGSCWLWTASISSGYGQYRSGNTMVRAHRYSYEAHKGPIPEGMVLDHLCRLPICVNPDHLEAVPQGVNVRRGLLPLHNRTHCTHGHDLTLPRAVVILRRHNRCRECVRAEDRRAYAKRKAA